MENRSPIQVPAPSRAEGDARPELRHAPGRLALSHTIAIVDIGSNSVRLVVYEMLARAPSQVFNEKEMAGLGRQVASTGWLADGEVPLRLGNDHPSIEPFATYAAADGDLMVGAGNDAQFRRLSDAIGAPELPLDPRFATNEARVANRAALRPLLEARLRTRTRADWRDVLLDAGVPSGPVQTIDEAFSLAAELGLDVIDETDGVRTVAFPALLSETPATVRRRPPELDEHGEELRRG